MLTMKHHQTDTDTAGWLRRLVRFRRCDDCGKINPPTAGKSGRLCLACAKPEGFYKIEGTDLRASGKVNRVRIRFPITIRWRGFFSF